MTQLHLSVRVQPSEAEIHPAGESAAGGVDLDNTYMNMYTYLYIEVPE